MTETLNVLTRLKSFGVTVDDEVEAAASMLESMAQHLTSDVAPVAKFVSEQLRLAVQKANNGRCSSRLLSIAIVWDRVSPRLYQMIQASSFLCMSHAKTLR